MQTQLCRSLAAHFETLLHDCMQLSECLEQEAQSLKSRDAQAIKDIAGRKRTLVNTLNQHCKHQQQLFKVLEIPIDKHKITEYLTHLESLSGDGVKLVEPWAALLEVAQHCRQLNETNGACVELLKQYSRNLLNILRGRNRNAAVTYGPDGATHHGSYFHQFLSV